jgi:BirA family biotin operon repressor/biotin-[acetyl-CoA-carboxylase] ligase
MSKDAQILAKLADGQFHSGQELAQQFGLSRSGIWKAMQSLQSKGVEVFAVQGKGYRLSQPLELLNSTTIESSNIYSQQPVSQQQASQQQVSHQPVPQHNQQTYPQKQATQQTERELTVLWDVDSTNRYLMNRVSSGCAPGSTCLAEMQTAGRGRRGREWVSPLGGNIYLSQLWKFNSGPAALSGLSLAAAIAVVRVIRDMGISQAGVKWPNDILVNGEKIAGILLEIQGESNGPTSVIVGIGLNVRLPDILARTIDQPYTSLEKLMQKPVPRNKLAANLINELLNVYQEFNKSGFAAFVGEWSALDVFRNKKINLKLPAGVLTGVSRGVDISGAIRLEQNGEMTSFQSGEVSLRG